MTQGEQISIVIVNPGISSNFFFAGPQTLAKRDWMQHKLQIAVQENHQDQPNWIRKHLSYSEQPRSHILASWCAANVNQYNNGSSYHDDMPRDTLRCIQKRDTINRNHLTSRPLLIQQVSNNCYHRFRPFSESFLPSFRREPGKIPSGHI